MELVTATASRVISSAILSWDGIGLTWRWIIKPTGNKLYNFIFRSNYKNHDLDEYITNKNKDKLIIEVLDTVTDDNGITTKYILFEKRTKITFNDPDEIVYIDSVHL